MTQESQGPPPTPGDVWRKDPTWPSPSLQKLVHPHLITHFLPANPGSILTEELAQGGLGTAPSCPQLGCRGASLLTLVPAHQQAKQVVAGLLQQDVVVAFVCAVRVVVISEVSQTVHCKEAPAFSSLGVHM